MIETCDVKREFIREYRGYIVTKATQVEWGTEKPCGCVWYEMESKVTGDKISTKYEWKIDSMLDYRLKANPHMFRVA